MESQARPAAQPCWGRVGSTRGVGVWRRLQSKATTMGTMGLSRSFDAGRISTTTSSSSSSCCLLLCWVVPKALIPKGKGRDVYPRVQVNRRAVCVVRAPCASVFKKGRRARRGRHGGSPPRYRS